MYENATSMPSSGQDRRNGSFRAAKYETPHGISAATDVASRAAYAGICFCNTVDMKKGLPDDRSIAVSAFGCVVSWFLILQSVVV
jgi:hypothetical protein